MFYWILRRLGLAPSRPYIAIMKIVRACDDEAVVKLSDDDNDEYVAFECGDLRVERVQLNPYRSFYRVNLTEVHLSYAGLTKDEEQRIFWATYDKYHRVQGQAAIQELNDYLKRRGIK